MRNGFPRIALSAFAALVVCGSAYAAGPTISTLPTVYITDKHKDRNEYDFETAATKNVFRFTDAFDLSAYVSDDDATDTLEFLFVEQDTNGDPLASGHTIEINGQIGLPSIPGPADFATGGQAIDNDPLDFETILTSVGTPTDPSLANDPGTQPTPFASFSDVATLDLYVSDSTNNIVMKTFTVITTNDGSLDHFTDASDVFQTVSCDDTMAGWTRFQINGQPLTAFQNFLSGVNTAPTAGTSHTADASWVPASGTPTGSIGFRSSVDEHAVFISWDGPQPFTTASPTTAGNVYVVRWTVSAQHMGEDINSNDVLTNINPTDHALRSAQGDLRFRVGDGSQRAGIMEDVVSRGINAFETTARTHETFYYANAASAMSIAFDGLDFSGLPSTNNTVGLAATLEKVEISTAAFSGLQNSTTVLHNGTGGTPFQLALQDVASDWVMNFSEPAGNPTPNRSFTHNATNTATNVNELTVTYADSVAQSLHSFETTAQADVQDVPDNKIVVLDVYARTDAAGATVGTSADGAIRLPAIRMGFFAVSTSTKIDPLESGNPGRTTYMIIRTDNQKANSAAANPPLGLSTTSRLYRVIFSGNLVRNTSLDLRPQIQIYNFTSQTTNNQSQVIPGEQGTLIFDQVQVRTYDRPAEGAFVTCP